MFISILFLIPFLWSISTSLKSPENVLLYPPQLIPKPANWNNYAVLWSVGDGVFRIYFINSLVVAGITVFLTLFVSSMAGYSFSKLWLRKYPFALLVLLTPLMVPFHSVLVPLFSLINKLGLLDTRTALVLIYSTFFLPFGVYMMKNSFDSIPDSIIESAKIDGCSTFSIFLNIMLPLSLPGLAAVTVFTFLNSWNEFLIALIFTISDNVKTLPVGLTMFLARYVVRWEMLNAGVVVSFIPVMLLFFLMQRYFVSGIISGAAK